MYVVRAVTKGIDSKTQYLCPGSHDKVCCHSHMHPLGGNEKGVERYQGHMTMCW